MPFTERFAWIADSIRDRLWLDRRLQIRPTDYVLDVGSGAGPNLRANVLCDKFAVDGTERMGQPLQSDRPCIIGDVEHLPFEDGAFDYVICSHVLEHLPRPDLALAELQRVAGRGYIETPSAEWEKVQGYPFHRWLVSLEGDTLSFREKPGPSWDAELSEWFNNLQDSLGIRRRLWFARRQVGVFTSLVWEGSVPHRMVRHDTRGSGFIHAETDSASHSGHQAPPGGRLGSRAVEAWMTKRLRRSSDRPYSELESLLRCPDCRGGLTRDNGSYLCRSCRTVFRVDDQGRPWLLPSSHVSNESLSRASTTTEP